MGRFEMNNVRRVAALLVSILVLLSPLAIVPSLVEADPGPSDWVITTVQSGGVSEDIDMAIDASNDLHLCYMDDVDGLKYATNRDGFWTYETIDSLGGYFVSIAIDSGTNAHVSYLDSNFHLSYATNTDSIWSHQTIDSVGYTGYYSSIAVDSQNKVHISYQDDINDDLKYATNAGGTWTYQTIDSSGYVGYSSSIAVNSIDKVYISYANLSSGSLKYATNNPGSWVNHTLDTPDIGPSTSLMIDSNDKLHISYHNSAHGNVKYGTNAEGAWSYERVDSGVTISSSSIAIDSVGNPHICYYNSSERAIKYASLVGSSWVIDDVYIFQYSPTFVRYAIGIDSNDRTYIAFYDSASESLRFATPKTCLITSEEIDIAHDESNSIAIDSNGFAHISYASYPNMDLIYATNAGGGWGSSTIDTSGFADGSSIAIDSNDKVHISYIGGGFDLKYATNAGGGWVVQTVDSLSFVGMTTSIALDSNDKAHISYFDSNGFILKYATNKDGSWSLHTLDASFYNGPGNSIAIDSDDKVHICYYDMANDDLKYTTNTGGSWSYQTIDNGTVGEYASMAIDQYDNIHISYYDYSMNGTLKYARHDFGGWTRHIVDDSGIAGKFNSIVVDSTDQLHISYNLGYPTYSLRYATNPQGVWSVVTTDVDSRMWTSIAVDSDNRVHMSSLGLSGSDFALTYTLLEIRPSAPLDLTANAGDTFVQLDWSPPSTDGGYQVKGYNIYQGLNPDDLDWSGYSVEPSFNSSSLVNGQTRYYQVRAYNLFGMGAPSPVVSATPGTVPSAPLSLHGEVGDSSVLLHWDPPENDGGVPIEGYNVYRGVVDASLSYLGMAVAPDFLDETVDNGQLYYYQVKAFNSFGEGAGSEIVTATPGTTPSAPLDFAPTAGDSFVRLEWSIPIDDGGFDIEGYNIYRGQEEISLDYLAPTNSTQFNDTSVINGQEYFYQVKAFNERGEGAPSEIVNAVPATVPSAPEGLQAEAGDSYVLLSWIAPSDGGLEIEGYNLYRGESESSLSLHEVVNGTQFNDTSVTNDQVYFYQVAAFNPLGEGPLSNMVDALPQAGVVQTVPSAPLNLEAHAGDSHVVLTWSPPESNGGAAITNFMIYRGTTPGSESHLITVEYMLEFTDDSVYNGITYYYQVTAVNSVGEGPPSDEVSATPVELSTPSAPHIIEWESGDSYVHISWTPPESDGGASIEGYRIYRGESALSLEFLTAVFETDFNDSTVVNGITYFYQVSALNELGEGDGSNIVNATPATLPSAPLALQAQAGDSYVLLSWFVPFESGGAAIEGYRVYRGESQSSLAFLVFIDDLQFNDTPVSNDNTYYYAVSAVNSIGEGPISEIVDSTPGTGIVPTIPSAPQGLQAVGGPLEIVLSWEPPADNGGALILYYMIYRGSSSESKSVVGSVSGTLQYTDSMVTEGVVYYYQVSAVNAVGEGSLSNEASASLVAGSPPSAPLDVSAAPGDGRITLTWSAPEDDGGSPITNYRIYRSTTSGSEVLLVTIGNVLTFTDAGLENGVTYYYKVSAVNGIGNGLLSDEVQATPSVPTVPSAPQEPQISSGEGFVLITWSAPSDDGGSDVISYNIYRGTESDNLTLLASVPGTQTSYNDTSVESGQTYYYRISAVNDQGESPQSTLVVDTPGGEDGGAADNTILIVVGVIVIIAVILILVFVLRRK